MGREVQVGVFEVLRGQGLARRAAPRDDEGPPVALLHLNVTPAAAPPPSGGWLFCFSDATLN